MMLLSGLANSVFWLGRYLERAEDLSRAFLAYEQIRLDIPGAASSDRPEAPPWQQLATLAGVEDAPTTDLEPGALAARVFLDRRNPSSLLGALHLARENLRRVRCLLPAGCWHTLNLLFLRVAALGPGLVAPAELGTILEQVVASSCEFAGKVAAGMVRAEAHAFLRMGVHLERADMMVRVVTSVADALIPDNHHFRLEDVRWMGVLRSVGASETYRYRHHTLSDVASALQLLVFEPTFPRSYAHGLLRIEHHLAGLPRNEDPHTALSGCWPANPVSTRAELNRFGEEAQQRLAHLSAVLETTYFSPAVYRKVRPEIIVQPLPGQNGVTSLIDVT